jgi:hypothetical protein
VGNAEVKVLRSFIPVPAVCLFRPRALAMDVEIPEGPSEPVFNRGTTVSELDYVHQCIEGKSNSIPDAISRHPSLGPRHLSPRGLLHSVEEVLKRIPVALKKSTTAHVHSGPDTADVKRLLQDWMDTRSAVQSLAPVRTGQPQKADFALMVPRPETAPVTLALHLLSPVPFAILVPIDLAALSHEPSIFPDAPHEKIRVKFDAAGKLTILASQMLWIIGNVPHCTPVEIFASALSVDPCSYRLHFRRRQFRRARSANRGELDRSPTNRPRIRCPPIQNSRCRCA